MRRTAAGRAAGRPERTTKGVAGRTPGAAVGIGTRGAAGTDAGPDSSSPPVTSPHPGRILLVPRFAHTRTRPAGNKTSSELI